MLKVEDKPSKVR